MVYGVGIDDYPKDWGSWNTWSKENTKKHNCWVGMIRRCYSKKFLEKEPTYIGCSVCDRWKRFSNFLEDIDKIPGYDSWLVNSGWCLDKDILIPGNRVYALGSVIFTTIGNNVSERNKRVGCPASISDNKKSQDQGKDCYAMIYDSGDWRYLCEAYGFRDLSRKVFGDSNKVSTIKYCCYGLTSSGKLNTSHVVKCRNGVLYQFWLKGEGPGV